MKKYAVLIFTGFFLLIRLYVAIFHGEPESRFADGKYYNEYAVGMLTHSDWLFRDYDTFDNNRPPVYPGFVALLYLLFGLKNYLAVYIAQAVLSAWTCYLVYRLALVTTTKQVAWLAFLWTGFYIPFLRYVTMFSRETLIILLVLLVLYYQYLYLINNTGKKTHLLLFLGSFILLIHTDPRYLSWLLILFFPFIFWDRLWHGFRKYVVFLSLVFVCMLPWLIRNYAVYGGWVVIDTKYLDLRHEKDNENVLFFMKRSAAIRTLSGNESIKPTFIKQSERDSIMKGFNPRNRSAGEIRAVLRGDAPDSTYWGRRRYMFVEFWSPVNFGKFSPLPAGTYGANSLRHNMANLISYGILLPFLVLSVFLMFRYRDKHLIFLFLPVAFQSLIHIFSWSRERYRHPVDSLIIILAMWAVIRTFQQVRKHLTSVKYAGTIRTDSGL
jgi:hypothetical protein